MSRLSENGGYYTHQINYDRGTKQRFFISTREMTEVDSVGPFWVRQEWPGRHLNIAVKEYT